MYFAYVLKSIEHDYFYKGHCKDLAIRIQQHNSEKTKSIRPYIPFRLIYFEKFESEADAIAREKYFKTSAGRKFIKKMLDLLKLPKLLVQVPCPKVFGQAGIPGEATTKFFFNYLLKKLVSIYS
jgi:putative endonuclease